MCSLMMTSQERDRLELTCTDAEEGNDAAETTESSSVASGVIVEYFELIPHIKDDRSCTLIPLDAKCKAPIYFIPSPIEGQEFSEILATDVSVDQNYVVTLSSNRHDTLTVDLWSLTSTDDARAEIPVASIPVLTKAAGDTSCRLGVCLSSDGHYVAVFQQSISKSEAPRNHTVQSTTELFPPRIFKSIDTPAVGKSLEDVTPNSIPLSKFIGHAKFQHLAPGNILPKDSQDHVFVAGSDIFLDVYDVSHAFELLYTIYLPSTSFGSMWGNPPFSYISSLRDEIFAWRNEYGEISIWNWRTAKCVEYIPSSDFHIIATSHDGSTLVGITIEGIASVYRLASGQLLGTVDCKISDAKTIVFGLDQFFVS